MKSKISKYFLIVSTFVMANLPAFAVENKGACELIKSLKPVIQTLRTLAFIGAAFVLMDWAWGWIKDGKVEKDKLKDQGIGMFVGFFVLFGVGMILQFVGSTAGADYFGCVRDVLNAK
jgi:membrane protease YdiL (CAAX protease family)